MTGLPALALPSFLSPTLLGAIGIALVAGGAGAYTAHKLDQIPLLKAQKETMAVQARYDGFRNGAIAAAAKSATDSLSEQNRLHGLLNKAQADLLETQRKADARSKALKDLLASASAQDTRPIGPTAAEYYRRVSGP